MSDAQEAFKAEQSRRDLAGIALGLSVCGVILWPLGFVGAYLGHKANRGGTIGVGTAAVVVGLVTGGVGALCIGSWFLRAMLGV